MSDKKKSAAILLRDHERNLDPAMELSFSLFHADGDLTGVLYKPHDPDRQQVHDQDEFYFIAAGSATLDVDDGGISLLRTGDAAMVPAGVGHRFLDASPEFKCWVVFFGPKA